MEKIRRNERMSAMLKLLTDHPNRIHTLGEFCEMFGAAKSTISEDIDLVSASFRQFDLGLIETVAGAAGGVRYRAMPSMDRCRRVLGGLAKRLQEPGRMLPGGFLYTSDVTAESVTAQSLGEILAMQYYDKAPDFVLTMETKGIPVALTTAHALGVPLVIARHASKVYEGSAVNINYVSGSSGHIETMSLSRRAVKEGQRALIVDDFLKGGGTAKGMVDLMHEFSVEVVGMAFVMETAAPGKKRVSGQKSLMILDISQDEQPTAVIRPADWLMA